MAAIEISHLAPDQNVDVLRGMTETAAVWNYFENTDRIRNMMAVSTASLLRVNILNNHNDGIPMGRINIDDLEPGMILAAEVKDRSGRVLLGPGQEITEKNLRVFRIWGVLEADIEGVEKETVDAKNMAQLDPEQLQHAEKEFESLFKYTDRTDPIVQELFRIATVRQVKQLTEGKDNGK